MGSRQTLLKLLPLADTATRELQPDAVSPDGVTLSEELIQLQYDTLSVQRGLVELSSFPPAYQERIKIWYRFGAYRYGSSEGYIAQRTPTTLDVV